MPRRQYLWYSGKLLRELKATFQGYGVNHGGFTATFHVDGRLVP